MNISEEPATELTSKNYTVRSGRDLVSRLFLETPILQNHTHQQDQSYLAASSSSKDTMEFRFIHLDLLVSFLESVCHEIVQTITVAADTHETVCRLLAVILLVAHIHTCSLS